MKIEFETGDPSVAAHFSVQPIKREVPGWYKDLDPFIEPESLDAVVRAGNAHGNLTMRHCVPILDYLTSGYVIRSTIHLRIRNNPREGTDEAGGLSYIVSNTSMVETHAHKQCPVHIGGKRLTYPKLNNPWRIITPKGYSCLFYQPFYADMETRLRLFPAIVDTDTYPQAVNFPGYVIGDDEVEILPGAPLMAVFPFKRDDWTMETRVRAKSEEDRGLMAHFLTGAHRRVFHQKKSYK